MRTSRIWHGVLAVVVATSLVTQIVIILNGGGDVNSTTGDGDGPGTRLLRFFSYFTVESNLFVVAIATSLALRPDRDGRWWRVARLDMLLGIAITGVVFVTILRPLVHPTGIAAWVNAGFHYVSPAMSVVGWLLFGPRPRVDWATVGWAFVWPVAWIVYTFAIGAATDWYPYPFLDVAKHGYGDALRNTGLVLVLALLLAIAVHYLDKRLPVWGQDHRVLMEAPTRKG
jgi:hypothetical protein